MASAALNLSQARTRLGSRELIEKIRAGSQVAVLVEELKVHPMYSLIKCKYGNFVLASLIQQAAPRDCADEVYAKIADNVRYVATHQFGSRIIEHLLENTSIVQLESLTAKLLTHRRSGARPVRQLRSSTHLGSTARLQTSYRAGLPNPVRFHGVAPLRAACHLVRGGE